MRESGRAEQITATIIETARQCNLDKDVALPDAEGAASLTMDQRDSVVGQVYRKLMEIESRLLPCGLHVVGVPPTAEEAIATLVNIAGAAPMASMGGGATGGHGPRGLCRRARQAAANSVTGKLTQALLASSCAQREAAATHLAPPAPPPLPPLASFSPELDRPDQKPEPIVGLPNILARAVGRNIEEVYTGSNKGVLADVDMLQRITEASRKCVREFVRDRTGERARWRVAWGRAATTSAAGGWAAMLEGVTPSLSGRTYGIALAPCRPPPLLGSPSRHPQAWTAASAPTS